MSKIELNGLYTYKPIDGEKPREIFYSGVSLPDGVGDPRRGVTFLYGQTATKEISNAIREAEKRGESYLILVAKAEVGKTGQISPENLKDTLVLNLRRSDASIENKIIQYWRGYLNEDGSPMPESFMHSAYAAERLDLLSRLVTEEPFKHVGAVIYPVKLNGGVNQYVTVFDLSLIKEIHCINSKDTKVTLVPLEDLSANLHNDTHCANDSQPDEDLDEQQGLSL